MVSSTISAGAVAEGCAGAGVMLVEYLLPVGTHRKNSGAVFSTAYPNIRQVERNASSNGMPRATE